MPPELAGAGGRGDLERAAEGRGNGSMTDRLTLDTDLIRAWFDQDSERHAESGV